MSHRLPIECLNKIFENIDNKVPRSCLQFTTYLGAVNCLRNLMELRCCLDVYSEIFHQI